MTRSSLGPPTIPGECCLLSVPALVPKDCLNVLVVGVDTADEGGEEADHPLTILEEKIKKKKATKQYWVQK